MLMKWRKRGWKITREGWKIKEEYYDSANEYDNDLDYDTNEHIEHYIVVKGRSEKHHHV
jgi:hypothetical protein